MNRLTVNLSPRQAADIVTDYVLREGMSTQLVDHCSDSSPQDGREVILLIFDKYYMRNGSRASLSVMIENIGGQTTVFSAGSGGSQGAVFNFDWGAAEKFASLPEQALRAYIV